MIDRVTGADDMNDDVFLFVTLEIEEDFVAVSGLSFGFLKYLDRQYFTPSSQAKVISSKK